MTSICFYFQVHQPFRLKNYHFFDIGKNHYYEDDELNRIILDKVSDKCYLPANRLMLKLIDRHKGNFRISYSISGTALSQMAMWRPDVLHSFQELAATGCVEFLAETYYHSLSFLFSKEEFTRQVQMHHKTIQNLFHQSPVTFRNTELIYYNELAAFVEDMGYRAILAEGVDRILGHRSPNFLYRAPNAGNIKLLLRNYNLSDDIAFRFSNKAWPQYPLTSEKFAHWAHSLAGNAQVLNLFMDYETFGEHQWAESGIFSFMNHLPDKLLARSDFEFRTPAEIAGLYPARDVFDAHNATSWADSERDLSAWLGNSIQHEAIEKIYSLEEAVKATGDMALINRWAKMLTSDHFYYMSTKFWSDGDVHKYFSPYNSPYDAYILYMNCFADFELQLKQLDGGRRPGYRRSKQEGNQERVTHEF